MTDDNGNKKAVDLSNALNDSGPSVRFEEYRVSRSYYPVTPKIIQWVIKSSGGFVKDEKQASYVLIGFVVAAVIISFFLIFGGKEEQEIFEPGAEVPAEQVIPPAKF